MMTVSRLSLALVFWSLTYTISALSVIPSHQNQGEGLTRRHVFQSLMTASIVVLPTTSAVAFDNRINDNYNDRPKQRGSMANDLGVRKRKDNFGEPYVGLKPCGPGPNCFCSTDPNNEDDPEHYIPGWKWPSSVTSEEDAFKQLEAVLSEYQPGQGNVDGGGFKIITSKPGYIYVQFESLKNGYIDDVEFATVEGMNGIQVRSSSRLGFLDFGVNAKRLNYIADALRRKGWDAEGVDFKTHPEYVALNRLQ